MPDDQTQLGFEQLGIGSVLSRNSLQVPVNQREYSWRAGSIKETDQVKELFRDLKTAISENAAEYFLGMIVAIPRKPGVLEVVDGQQRLATIAILLAAMRDALRDRPVDKLIVERIEHTFLSTIDPHARQRVSRIRLNSTDSAFFEDRVLKCNKTAKCTSPSHHRIDNAAQMAEGHVKEILRGFSESDYGDLLNRWVDFIEHQAVVILLKVPSSVNAYKMFETLNDRGLDTSQSDLVKNYLFGECKDRLAEAQQKWSSMRFALESSSDEEDITKLFLRQMLISMYGHLRKEQVYEVVQRYAKGTTTSLSLLRSLELGASDYVALSNTEHEKWNAYPTTTRRAIQTIILLRMTPMRPLMLSIVRHLNPKEADRALRMLVNLSVRFLIVGGARSGAGEEAFAAAAKGITDGAITDSPGLLAALTKVGPADVEFEDAFRVATVSQITLARYYLRSLELTVKNEPHPSFIPNDDQQSINLEHVLPQNPEGNYPEFTPEQADVFHKRIGNMVLLQAKSNSAIRNAKFSLKRKTYKQSPYELTRQLADFGKWTPGAINERQISLAALAVKTWPIQPPSQ
jgi:hypothetical protein